MIETYYAEGIVTAVARGMDPKEAVRHLCDALAASGRTKLLPKIARALAQSAKRTLRKGAPELLIAREADREVAIEGARTALGGDLGVIRTRIDDTLIGGWVLSAGDRRIDASFKKQLRDLYRNITA